jgi:glycoside/pentoside/hexuronide:cation symporter, GPH family
MSQKVVPPPGRVATAAYAAGSFGTGVFSTVPAILLLYFCTETLHMAAAWAAVVVFVPKVWAIAWDPLVGVWSDRSATRIGRRRPFLIVGACGVAAAFVAVFSPPVLDTTATFAWMATSYFLLATVYSVFAVPYVAIPSEIPATAEVRARLVAWRMFVAMIGVLAGAGVVPYIVEFAGGGRGGYRLMSVCIAAACFIAMLTPLGMLWERDPAVSRTDHRTRGPVWDQFKAVLGHRAFLGLSGSYVLQLTAVGVLSASAPYLVTGAFGRGDGDIGTAMIGMLGMTTLATPLWAWAGRRLGNTRMLILAVLLFAGGTMAIGGLALTRAAWPSGQLAFALAGIPFAGMQVLPYTLVAHLIHATNSGGDARESSFTGVWTACEKLGLAFGPSLTALALALGHEHRVDSVATLVVIGPAILGLLSLPLLATATNRQKPQFADARS